MTPYQRIRRVGIFLLFAFLFGWALWIWNTWQEDMAARTSAGVTTISLSTGSSDVRVDAAIHANRLTIGRSVPVTMLIQNPQKETPLTVQILSFRPEPGFEPYLAGANARCWENGRPVCVVGPDGRAMYGKWPWTLAPGAAVTVIARVRATDETGRWSLLAMVSSQAKNAVPTTKLVNLGPAIVESRAKAGAQTFLRGTQKYLKDLGLPIIAAILGYWFKREEERRTQANSVYSLMLPKTHERNEKYYMPISSAAGRIARKWRKIPTDPKAADECFFFFWIFHRRGSEMSDQVGGWYFKDRQAEEVIGTGWNAIFEWTVEAFTAPPVTGRELREEALAKMRTGHLRFAIFQDRLAVRPPFLELRAEFDRVIASGELAVVAAAAELIEFLLDYEMNRSYIYWYDKMEPFDLEGFDELVETFRNARTLGSPGVVYAESDFNDFDAELQKYREHVLPEAKA